jgi:hypothetical protein
MKTAVISIIAVLGLIVNLNSSPPVDTVRSDATVVSFISSSEIPNNSFPDRTEQTKQAQQLDQQRETARLEALRQAELAKQANIPIPAQTTPTMAGSSPDGYITALGQCESGNTATRNSGNGYYGAFQFSVSTWNAMGTGYPRADLAPYEVQVAAVKKLLSRSSVRSQFPGCSKKLGL